MARGCYLVSYDVSDDRARQKIAHLLEGYGERVQYSVFELWVTDKEMEQLRRRLARWVEKEGSVRIYWLCAACQARREVLGEGEPTAPPGLKIV